MPHKFGRKGSMLAGLILAATAAWIWTDILLLSQNTLLYNGSWISAKRMLRTDVMGNGSFLITRAALSRNRLNMGAWYGFNEVLYKHALRPREFRFGLKLKDKADLSVIFGEEASTRSPGAVSGLRLSRNPGRGPIFFESTPSGRFISKSVISPFPFDGGRHLVSLRFQDGRVKVSLDGKEVASREANTQATRLLGWRAGPGQSFIDSVSIEDASGEVFADSFRNTKHRRRILLIHAALFLLLWGVASLIPSLDAAGLLLAVTTAGLLGLGFDYAFWSGLQVDSLSTPVNALQMMSPLRPVERLRYTIFERWNGLLTGAAAVTPQDLRSRGYPAGGKAPRAIYCSSDSECSGTPLFPVRKKGYRILLVGTSQAHGAGADRLEDTFFVLLHRRLARRFSGRLSIESLNMSVDGSQASALLADYKDRGLAFNPDLVLISLGNNDAADSLRSGLTGFLALNRSHGIETVLLKEANFRAENSRLLAAHGVIQELGKEFQAPVWDLNRFLMDAQEADSGFLWWDDYHLTSYGQSLVAPWLSPQVAAFIDEPRRSTAPAAGRTSRDRSKDYETWANRGASLRAEGRDAEAETAFRKALAFPSEDFRAENAIAGINAGSGRWQTAAEFYERARRKAPSNYMLCTLLARTYANMGRLDLAKKTYAEAKSIDPRQADAYINEGYANLYAGEYAQAKEQFQSVISIDTSNPYGYHHMASYFKDRGDLAEAERDLRKAWELLDAQFPPYPPNHPWDVLHAMCNLSLILGEEGRLAEEESILRQALPMSLPFTGWHVEILEMLAEIYARQGKRPQAEEYFQQAVGLCRLEASCSRFPLVVGAGPLNRLGALYAAEGRTTQAREAADKAWSRYPAAGRMQELDIPVVLESGAIYAKLGDDAKAEKAYRLVISQHPRMPSTQNMADAETRLAYICRKTGKYEEAFELYRDAIRIQRLHGKPKKMILLELKLALTWIKACLHPWRLGSAAGV